MKLDKLKKLSKEQRQHLVLGVMVLGGLFYAFWQFGLQPILLKKQEAEGRIKSLTEQRRKEKLLLGTTESSAAEYRQTRDRIRTVITEHLPPYENALGWATELFGAAAASAGLQETDLAIKERGSGAELIRRRGQNLPPGLLAEFRVAVEFRASYHQMGEFLAALERRNPYVFLGTLSANPSVDKGGEDMNITLECVVPRFSREAFPKSADPDAPRPIPPERGPAKEDQ